MQQFLKYNFSRGFERGGAKTSGFFKPQKIRTKEKFIFQELPKVIVILGQTATGKSNLAVKIAKKVDGEIISADSRQVYKGLNIGTGKITAKEMRGIRHYLLDVVNLKKKLTVAEYQKLAISAMADIVKRGKTPIICGGSGFYIDAITKSVIFPEVPPNQKLRKALLQKETTALFRIIKKLDPNRAKTVDPKNKVRLIRAIEIAKALGQVPPITQAMPVYKFIKIGLYLPPDKLKEKIRIRLFARIREGMIQETKALHARGLSWQRMKEFGLEYKFMALYLQNKISKEKMLEELNTKIYQYAKRQMTWFKRDKEIKWFDASSKDLFWRASKKINLSKIL